MRRALSETWSHGPKLGTAFEQERATGALGLAQLGVKTMMHNDIWAESWIARATYWLGTLAALALSGFWAWPLITRPDILHEGLILTPLVLAASALVYLAGWGWRWLWTGPTDHLFAAKIFTPPGKLEETRKYFTSILALWEL